MGTVLRILVFGPLGFVTLVLIIRASGKRTLSKMNTFDFVVTIALGSLFATVISTRKSPWPKGRQLLPFSLSSNSRSLSFPCDLIVSSDSSRQSRRFYIGMG